MFFKNKMKVQCGNCHKFIEIARQKVGSDIHIFDPIEIAQQEVDPDTHIRIFDCPHCGRSQFIVFK